MELTDADARRLAGVGFGRSRSHLRQNSLREAPEWLATGSLEDELLVRLDLSLEGAWPIVVELDDLTLGWGEWDDHLYLLEYAWPQIDPAIVAVRLIEGILSGWWVRAVAFSPEDAWQASMLRPTEELRDFIISHDSKGNRVVVTRSPDVEIHPDAARASQKRTDG